MRGERARRRIARGLQLDDYADLAILRNASEGNNQINCGYRNWRRTDDPSERDNVVLWEEDHPTNREAWWLRAQWDARDDLSDRDKMLFEIREVSFPTDASDQEIADSFISRIDRAGGRGHECLAQHQEVNALRDPKRMAWALLGWFHPQEDLQTVARILCDAAGTAEQLTRLDKAIG